VKENGKRKAIMKYGGQLKECKINSAKRILLEYMSNRKRGKRKEVQ
jgi:hypothetical protein